MSVESELRKNVRPSEPTGIKRDAITMVRAALNIEDTLRGALKSMVAMANRQGTIALVPEINKLASGGSAWMAERYVEARQRLVDAGEDVSDYPVMIALPTLPPAPVIE